MITFIKKLSHKVLLYSPIFIGIVIVSFTIHAKLDRTDEKTTIISSATLMDVIDIAELSTAQYTYNGIAEIYKDQKKKKIKCYIKYNAKIKAGIDIEQIELKIDDENKTVTPILPKIQIKSNIVDEDCLSFIPDDTDISLKEALAACKEDSMNEAKKSTELIDCARGNLESTIEGLMNPILKSNGYRIIWK